MLRSLRKPAAVSGLVMNKVPMNKNKYNGKYYGKYYGSIMEHMEKTKIALTIVYRMNICLHSFHIIV